MFNQNIRINRSIRIHSYLFFFYISNELEVYGADTHLESAPIPKEWLQRWIKQLKLLNWAASRGRGGEAIKISCDLCVFVFLFFFVFIFLCVCVCVYLFWHGASENSPLFSISSLLYKAVYKTEQRASEKEREAHNWISRSVVRGLSSRVHFYEIRQPTQSRPSYW